MLEEVDNVQYALYDLVSRQSEREDNVSVRHCLIEESYILAGMPIDSSPLKKAIRTEMQ